MNDRQDLNPRAVDQLKKFGGEARAKKVLDIYLGHLPEMIVILRDALENHDHETLRKTAHTLKSSAGPVGAEILLDIVKRIEVTAGEGDDDSLATLVPQVEPAFLRTKVLIEAIE